MLKRNLVILTVIGCLLMVFCTSAYAANPDKVYGKIGNDDVIFNFNDLWNAYMDDNATYIAVWVSSTKVSLVFGSRVLSFDDFFAKFGDDVVSTPEEYNNLPNAMLVTPPGIIKLVGSNGTLGDAISNPDIVADTFEVVDIY